MLEYVIVRLFVFYGIWKELLILSGGKDFVNLYFLFKFLKN